MASIQRPSGDGNRRSHHRQIDYRSDNLSIKGFLGVDGPMVRVNNGDGDLTTEQWAELVQYILSTRPGPDADAYVRAEVREMLRVAFDIKDTWKATTLDDRLLELGFKADVIDEVRRDMGIDTQQVYRRHGGINYWVWTTASPFNWRAYRDAHPELDR